MTQYNGVNLPDPPPGEIALGAVVLIKIMKGNGEIAYRECTSDSLHPIEMLGMTETFKDTLKAQIMGTLQRPGQGHAA